MNNIESYFVGGVNSIFDYSIEIIVKEGCFLILTHDDITITS